MAGIFPLGHGGQPCILRKFNWKRGKIQEKSYTFASVVVLRLLAPYSNKNLDLCISISLSKFAQNLNYILEILLKLAAFHRFFAKY